MFVTGTVLAKILVSLESKTRQLKDTSIPRWLVLGSAHQDRADATVGRPACLQCIPPGQSVNYNLSHLVVIFLMDIELCNKAYDYDN